MAIIYDEEEAKKSACTCFYVGDKTFAFPLGFKKSIREIGLDYRDVICFSDGIVGALDDELERKYCNGGIVIDSPRIKRRLRCIRKCLERCTEKQ